MIKRFILQLLLAGACAVVQAQSLPDVLRMNNGSRVRTAAQWPQRRTEILELYRQEVFGQAPPKPANLHFELLETARNAFQGKATRKQIRVSWTTASGSAQFVILLYLPNRVKRPAVILGLNFYGNQTIGGDDAVLIDTNWVDTRQRGMANYRATSGSRGINGSQWPVEMILDRGYALATVYAGDIDPDRKDGYPEGIRSLYPSLRDRPDNFSTIGAWAWGLSRALDYLFTDREVNAARVAVMGHSRMGKAAIWAGASDPRFGMVISNESGKGGASLFNRQRGETIRHLNTSFPHWFCSRFSGYNDHEGTIAFDQHFLLSLVAPRPLYVASAAEDLNSDPEGEFLATKEASIVYRLLGTQGLLATRLPLLNQPVVGRESYHLRNGKHDAKNYDWVCYLDFADRMWGKPRAD